MTTTSLVKPWHAYFQATVVALVLMNLVSAQEQVYVMMTMMSAYLALPPLEQEQLHVKLATMLPMSVTTLQTANTLDSVP